MCAGDQGKEGPSPKDYRHDENYPGVGEETPAPKLISGCMTTGTIQSGQTGWTGSGTD